MKIKWILFLILSLGLTTNLFSTSKVRHFSQIYSIDSNAIQCQIFIDNWNVKDAKILIKKISLNPDFKNSLELQWLYEIFTCQIESIENNFESAKESILKAINLSKEVQNPEMLIESFIVCGDLFEKQGDIPNALSFFLAAEDLLDKGHMPSRKPFILNKIGTIFFLDKNFNQAANYFFEANRLYNLYKDSIIGVHYWMQNAYGNLGLCYEELKDYKKSLFYFKMALKVIQIGYFPKERPLGVIYSNMGHLYLSMGDLKNAVEYYEKGIQYTLDPNQHELRHGAKKQLELAKILIQMNLINDARWRIDSSLKIINAQSIFRLKGAYFSTELAYYESIGKLDAALFYSKKFNDFQDSIYQTQLKLGLSKQILSHSLNQKIVENELLHKDNELYNTKNKGYLGILLTMAVLFLGIIYVLSAQNKRNLELKEALSEIEIQKQELQFSNSNINYLLQTVAHDLRTPVGNNLSLSNLLLESLKLHPEDKDLVKMMNTSSQHALSIMEDLLDHSLIERGEIILNLNNFNLNELIIEAVQVLNYKADTKGIKIITKLPENSIYANIDGSRISRVIQNLITNAIKFSQNNKSIIIELIENPEKYIISVKDFGIGMDEITIEFSFDSFTSVGRTGTSGEKSYGLGLSICKKLVELHFGRLYVESIAGNGSTFYIEIPKLN